MRHVLFGVAATLLCGIPETWAAPPKSLPFPLQVVQQDERGVRLETIPEHFDGLRDHAQVVLQEVPLPGAGFVALDLKRQVIATEDAVLVVDGTARPLREVAEHVLMWSGRVQGEAESWAFLALSPFGSRGLVRKGGDAWQLRVVPDAAGRAVQGAARMVRLSAEEAAAPAAGCLASDIDQFLAPPPSMLGPPPETAGFAPAGATLRQANIAVETDYQFFQKFGNADDAATYALTLFAASSSMYQAQCDAIFQLPYLGIHSKANDGWSAQDSGGNAISVLNEFRNEWKSGQAPVAADLYHFLSGASLGGGVAYLNVLCSQAYGFGVSGNINGGLAVPVTGPAPWDLVVVSHEIGHNFVSPHTHDYCPPLDECAPGSYFGNCQDAQLCIPDGTLMSYCHLCAGGMSNIDLRFHDTVAANIRAAVAASCLQPVEVQDSLCADLEDLHVDVDPEADPTASATLLLANCGPAGGTVAWTATVLDAAPWLQVVPPSGTTGPDATEVQVALDGTGLPIGPHTATLRFQNDGDPDDVLDVPVTLRVLAPPFVPGDQLTGTVTDGAAALACFPVLKGMTLKLAVTHTGGAAPLAIEVLNGLDQGIGAWSFQPGQEGKAKKKLKTAGTFTLQIAAGGPGEGTFAITTAAKLPKQAKPRTLKKVKAKHGNSFADVTLAAFAGALLDVQVKPAAKFSGPVTVQLYGPDDVALDLTGHVTPDGLQITDLPLPASGSYRVRVFGYQKAKDKVTVIVVPTQPVGAVRVLD